jgi:hypothetical protein
MTIPIILLLINPDSSLSLEELSNSYQLLSNLEDFTLLHRFQVESI